MALDAAQIDAIISDADLPAIIGSVTAIQQRGNEWLAKCCFHSPDNHPSLSIYHAGNGSGRWRYQCFACGADGDALQFLRDYEGLDFKEALEQLNGGKVWTPQVKPSPAQLKPKAERVTSKPPPGPEPDMTIRQLGKPARVWTYRDAEGDPIGYVARYETPEGKQIRCWTWGARGDAAPAWGCGHWSKPRPLYCLDKLASTKGQVVIVEGEKAADAAQHLLTVPVITWPGGAPNWKNADWTPIAGRSLVLWPDADEPGREVMADLAALASDPKGLNCKQIKIIRTDDLPAKYDAADWREEHGTDGLLAWLKERAVPYERQTPKESNRGPQSDAIPIDAYRDDPPPENAPPPNTAKPGRKSKPRLAAVRGNAVPEPSADDAALPQSMSEDAIADAFAEEHAQNWRYVAAWGHWMHWDGDGWQRDRKELVDRLAVEMCRRACTWTDAQSLTPDGKRRLGQRKTAGAIRDIARNDRRLAASPEGWDADPLLVGIPGGVFDVRAGKVVMGEREQYITRRTLVAPATGTPKRWLDHLNRMMDGDESMIRFLQTFAGYCATGDVSEQCFLFLYGQGQTGKGTFLLTLGELLGGYAAQAGASTFMSTDREKHSSEIARLASCRLVIVDETDGTARWNEERIKRMTGGGKITAARKYHDEEDIPVTWKLAFAGNHKPALRGVGKEMQRRIRLVKCNASIPDEIVDRNFRANMIAQEGPQILNWILEGAVMWHESGLPLPESVSEATREYLESEDVIGEWLEQNCEQSGRCERPAAYRNYSKWAEGREDRPWSSKSWWSAMEDRGYTAKKSAGVFYIQGLSLIVKDAPIGWQDSDRGYEVP